MTTGQDEHDQDADPPTPDGQEPDAEQLEPGSEPASHPDPDLDDLNDDLNDDDQAPARREEHR